MNIYMALSSEFLSFNSNSRQERAFFDSFYRVCVFQTFKMCQPFPLYNSNLTPNLYNLQQLISWFLAALSSHVPSHLGPFKSPGYLVVSKPSSGKHRVSYGHRTHQVGRLGWLAREPKGSTSACLPSAGITSKYYHTKYFYVGSRQ